MPYHRLLRHSSVALTALVTLVVACASGRKAHRGKLDPPRFSAIHTPATPGVVSAGRYFSHIQLLAHDDLKGRGTGSDGIDLAAGYIAGHFAAAGVAPGGPTGTYFQEFSITGWNFLSNNDDMLARNVVGFLPGTGEDADQCLVIGAHYDHLGERKGAIYNGADDNASGAATLIELAYVLAAAPIRNRSVVFVAFTGEEIGLKGSAYYIGNPTVPASNIICMINMDMVGRMNSDEVNNRLGIYGLGTGGSFHEIVEHRAAEAGLPYIPDESALGPSDHMSFYLAGVPSLFFFTGVHDDYHRPSDDVEKINVDGAVRITELVARVALDIVQAQESPRFAQVTQPAKIFRSANTVPRAVLGVGPSMDDAGEMPGVLIAVVAPNSGADRAGLRPSDRITRVDGVTIANPMELRSVLASKKPGEYVLVALTRDGEDQTVEVELLAPEAFDGTAIPSPKPPVATSP